MYPPHATTESPEPALADSPSRAWPRRLEIRRWHKLLLIFGVVFGVHVNCEIIASSDSADSIHLAHSRPVDQWNTVPNSVDHKPQRL
jgi:hypothetical protein